jgi:hypothetical protein
MDKLLDKAIASADDKKQKTQLKTLAKAYGSYAGTALAAWSAAHYTNITLGLAASYGLIKLHDKVLGKHIKDGFRTVQDLDYRIHFLQEHKKWKPLPAEEFEKSKADITAKYSADRKDYLLQKKYDFGLSLSTIVETGNAGIKDKPSTWLDKLSRRHYINGPHS